MYSMAIKVSVSGCVSVVEMTLTLREDLPLARLAAGRVGEYLVELIEEILHLATTLPFGHLVADAELGSATVVSTPLGERSMVHALETCDAAVLHRVVMRC